MSPGPYRSRTPDAPRERDGAADSERLGARVETFRRPALAATLRQSFLVVFVILAVGLFLARAGGVRVVAVVVPFAALGGALFAWSPFRHRNLTVELHTAGVAVTDLGRREVTVFEDVREVWYVLEGSADRANGQARVTALRLVREDGSRRLIRLTVLGGDRLARAIEQHCSLPLRAAALESLREGAVLTFGPYRIDAHGIATDKRTYEWDELTKVRLQPGRVHFVAKGVFVPTLVVDLDQVPHPSVFLKLVMSCAKTVVMDGRAPSLGP